MEFSIKARSPETAKAGCVVVGVHSGKELTPAAKRIDQAARGALRRALGDLSGKPGSTLLLRDLRGVAAERVLLVGLGERKGFGETQYRDALLATLTTALQDVFAQVVDNSGGLITLRLAGPDHLMLLRQLGPYDFESLAVGRCASTVVSKTGLTVVRTDEAGVLLVFRRSFADYTWRLLERTAQPYRLCITSPQQCADPVFTPLFEIV